MALVRIALILMQRWRSMTLVVAREGKASERDDNHDGKSKDRKCQCAHQSPSGEVLDLVKPRGLILPRFSGHPC